MCNWKFSYPVAESPVSAGETSFSVEAGIQFEQNKLKRANLVYHNAKFTDSKYVDYLT